MSSIKDKFSDFCLRLPLFGKLFGSRKSPLKDAAFETLVGTLFSTLPIWFIPVLVSVPLVKGPSFLQLVSSSIENGDLFIYSAALVGPIIYAITKNYLDEEEVYDKGKSFTRLTIQFPYGASFVIISIILCMIAALGYGLITFLRMSGEEAVIERRAVMISSSLLYLFSLMCLFTVTSYRNELANVNKSLGSDEKDFLAKWRSRND